MNKISFEDLIVKFSLHHHHHIVPLARISLTLSRQFSRLFIASGRSSGLHPVYSHSCYMYVRAGRPAFARPYVGVHRSTSLMGSSLLLQQCPGCLVLLTWTVFVMEDMWPYSYCLVGCCRQDLFNIARNGFRRNRSTTSQILTICRILEGVQAKNLRWHYYQLILPRPSIPFTEGRWNKSY